MDRLWYLQTGNSQGQTRWDERLLKRMLDGIEKGGELMGFFNPCAIGSIIG